MTAPVIERVLAPNPSLYTGQGTNSYLMRSEGEVLVLDPGPVIDVHLAAIRLAIGDATPVGVVVTHTHPDHAPLANPMADALGVPTYGYADGPSFVADVTVSDGGVIAFGSDELVAVHTPGHTPDHLCFTWGEVLFTGDHIMGGSTVIIEDATEYLESLYRVAHLGAARIEPGHGDAMDDAGAAIAEYIDHRLARERQILDAIGSGASTLGDVVDAVYADVPAGLRPAASHQVRVQLTKLFRDSAVWFDAGQSDETAPVRLR